MHFCSLELTFLKNLLKILSWSTAASKIQLVSIFIKSCCHILLQLQHIFWTERILLQVIRNCFLSRNEANANHYQKWKEMTRLLSSPCDACSYMLVVVISAVLNAIFTCAYCRFVCKPPNTIFQQSVRCLVEKWSGNVVSFRRFFECQFGLTLWSSERIFFWFFF